MAATTPEELAFIRAQYSGKLTMVDRWFGELLKKLDELALWDQTAVIVTTDHGHDLGERGKFGKQYPHYDSHANIPLLVWHPGYPGGGRAISALTSTVDLFPTVLQIAGAPEAGQPHGRSLLQLIETGGAAASREALLYGTFGEGVCATDGEWTIFKSPQNDGPLYSYSAAIYRSQNVQSAVQPARSGHYIPGAALPQWQVPLSMQPLSRVDFLFNRVDDPRQAVNLWEDEPRQRERMLGILRELLSGEGAPPEQYARLGLS
jgi:arylsulfatase A-like enzyme